MAQKSLNECGEPRQEHPKQPKDPYANYCPPENAQFRACEGVENMYNAPNAEFQGLDDDITFKREGLGEPNYCDPMLTGQIVDDKNAPDLPPDKSVIYRYNQGFRSIDEAVKRLMMNIVVIADDGQVFPVPVIWGSQEAAVQFILQSNIRKDNTGVVDRIVLPMISVYTSDYGFPRERFIHHMALDYKRGVRLTDRQGQPVGSVGGSPSWVHREKWDRDTVLGIARGIPVDLGYTVTIWTMFWEDMNQILEQIATKFNPLAYIRVQGVTNWESTVRIDSVGNNLDLEPGDTNKRVFKFQVSMTAESYLPQPIVRRKAVLKTKVEFVDDI
ncbi:hypothetical protein DRQ00_09095, partial [candidate division KSB1 bacterium]